MKDNWQPDLFSETTSVIDLNTHLQKHEAHHIILKDIPKDISEAEILNEIQQQYKSCMTVERFIKDGKALYTVKCTLKNKNEFETILTTGVYLNDYFIMPEKYIPIKKPIICTNCQNYGHLAKICNKKNICVYCSEEHKSVDCIKTNSPKCLHCNGPHKAHSLQCPSFQASLKKINNINTN